MEYKYLRRSVRVLILFCACLLLVLLANAINARGATPPVTVGEELTVIRVTTVIIAPPYGYAYTQRDVVLRNRQPDYTPLFDCFDGGVALGEPLWMLVTRDASGEGRRMGRNTPRIWVFGFSFEFGDLRQAKEWLGRREKAGAAALQI